LSNKLALAEAAKEEILRQLIKTTDALELIGSVTNEGMPLTLESAQQIIKKYQQ